MARFADGGGDRSGDHRVILDDRYVHQQPTRKTTGAAQAAVPAEGRAGIMDRPSATDVL
jgi:hypothetical protein